MRNRPVDKFLRNQTALLMEDSLLIGKADALKILENYDTRETKIFADNVENLKKYIENLAYPQEGLSARVSSISEELEGGFKRSEHSYIFPSFNTEFKELIRNNKSPLLVEKLSLFFAMKEILWIEYSIKIFFPHHLPDIHPQSLPKFYKFLCELKQKKLELYREYEADIIYKTRYEVDITSTVIIEKKIEERLKEIYKNIPPKALKLIIERDSLSTMINADRALKDVLFIPQEDRDYILLHFKIRHYNEIPRVVQILKENVLDLIQTPLARNRYELISTVFSPNYQFEGWANSIVRDLWPEERKLFPKMQSEKFTSMVLQLPVVIGKDEYDHKLDAKVYDQNQHAIYKAYDMLAGGAQNLTGLNYEFQSLPPTPFVQTPTGFITTMSLLAGIVGLSAYSFYALRRMSGFWTRALGLSTEGKNNILLEHLGSLPPPDPKPDFLSTEELEKFRDNIEKITDPELKKYNQNILKRYEDFISLSCSITLEDAASLSDPLTIQAVYYKPDQNRYNIFGRDIIRQWTKIHDFNSLVDYIKRLNRWDPGERIFAKPAILPETRDNLVPDKDSDITFLRGYPSYLQEYIDIARRMNSLENVSRNNAFFPPVSDPLSESNIDEEGLKPAPEGQQNNEKDRSLNQKKK